MNKSLATEDVQMVIAYILAKQNFIWHFTGQNHSRSVMRLVTLLIGGNRLQSMVNDRNSLQMLICSVKINWNRRKIYTSSSGELSLENLTYLGITRRSGDLIKG